MQISLVSKWKDSVFQILLGKLSNTILGILPIRPFTTNNTYNQL